MNFPKHFLKELGNIISALSTAFHNHFEPDEDTYKSEIEKNAQHSDYTKQLIENIDCVTPYLEQDRVHHADTEK